MTTEQGLHQKYIVQRTDGTDAPGEKHDGCEYFVLDLTHDPVAVKALWAYAVNCRDNPTLAADLFDRCHALGFPPRIYDRYTGDQWDGR